ncbi:OmpA family protein [Candidatus Falkowbacteria bacterium]|nr:OmpA family protein [Candidatus Falkowbacteria bacterium]
MKKTYASFVALICAMSLLFVTLIPNQALAATKPAVNEEAATSMIPLNPDWEIQYFPTGFSTVTREIEQQIQPLLAWHKSHPEDMFIVMGAVSDKPFSKDSDNKQMQLATDRAMAVHKYLTDNAVPKNKIVILKSNMIAIEKGNYRKNQKVMVWHAYHPELSSTPLVTENKPCPPQQECPVPKCDKCDKAPNYIVNVPPQCTKEESDVIDPITGIRTITINVTCPDEVQKEMWCKAHKGACTALIIGGIVLIGGILAIGCAQGASGPNGSGGDAGFCF